MHSKALERCWERAVAQRSSKSAFTTLPFFLARRIKHVAAAGEGSICTTRAELREVVDGRKLRFDVEVTDGDRTIGVGTHERRVIDVPGS